MITRRQFWKGLGAGVVAWPFMGSRQSEASPRRVVITLKDGRGIRRRVPIVNTLRDLKRRETQGLTRIVGIMSSDILQQGHWFCVPVWETKDVVPHQHGNLEVLYVHDGLAAEARDLWPAVWTFQTRRPSDEPAYVRDLQDEVAAIEQGILEGSGPLTVY